MLSAEALARRIQEDFELAALLAESFDFDVRRQDSIGEPRVASGRTLTCVAGDFAGGSFFVCDADGSSKPIVYASSEGEGGLIAQDFRGALMLVIGLPYWHDCLTYSGGGDLRTMERAVRLLQRDAYIDRPELSAEQGRATELLGLNSPPVVELLKRLHIAVSATEPDFAFADSTGDYGTLFGPFTPERNRRWQ